MGANVNVTGGHNVPDVVEHRSRVNVIAERHVNRPLGLAELLLQLVGRSVPNLELGAGVLGILRLAHQIFDVQEKFLQIKAHFIAATS